MKEITRTWLQMPARPKTGNKSDYDCRCAHCCTRGEKDCRPKALNLPDCEPTEEFPAGSYFILGATDSGNTPKVPIPQTEQEKTAMQTTQTMYIYTDTVPENCDYLTSGKRYKVREHYHTGFISSYHIVDDEGDFLICLHQNCSHLNGGNWKTTT